jgi:hypothetical protein
MAKKGVAWYESPLPKSKIFVRWYHSTIKSTEQFHHSNLSENLTKIN